MIHQKFLSTFLVLLLICSKLYSLELADFEGNKSTIANSSFACNSLLTNSGFESDLVGWNTSDNGVTISSDAVEGNKAVVLNNTGTTVGLWQDIPGSANEIYSVKLFAKKTNSAEPSIGIEFFDASGTLIDDKFIDVTSTTYQEYSFSAMTPNNTAKVQIIFWNGKGTGEVFFDDICFEKLTVDPISCSPSSVNISSSNRSVYVMDHSGNNTATKDYDYGDIKLCDNGDGTLSIRGYVIGGHDSDWHESVAIPCGVQDAWYIDLLLSDVQVWEEFQDSYVQQEGCAANRVDWDFWQVSGSYVGIGCNTGRIINVLSAAPNYRLQVGWGGNSQSCDFGLSTWFIGEENGTNTYSDLYFHIKEIDYETVRPPRKKNPGCKNNLLFNPSFEDSPTSNPPNWIIPTASTFNTTSNYKVTGNLSAQLYHSGAGTGQVYQQVTGIIPGNNYSLSFYGGTHQPNHSHTVKIEFYNNSNTLLETSPAIEVDKDVDGNNTLNAYNLDAIAPPNATYLRVVGTAEEDYLIVDEVCLTTDQNICDNSITNSEFNNGTADWTFKTTGNARLNSSLDIDNTSLLSGAISAFINIGNNNHEVSDIQLLHDDLSLLAGEQYLISFQAKASMDRPITVALQKKSDPSTIYKQQIFNLTTSPNVYYFSYTPNSDNIGDVELTFQFGGNNQEVYLDKINYSAACDLSCPEFLTNTEFDNGTTDWNLIVNSTNSVATLSIDNSNKLSGSNAAFIDVPTAGPDSWNIQLIQIGQSLELDKEYTFSFEAMALVNRPIAFSIQKATADYKSYFSREVTVTTKPQTYSYNFIASVTNIEDVAIIFHLANEAGGVFIDNVHFSESCGTEICDNNIDDDQDGLIDEEDPFCSSISTCSSTGPNLFDNPSFENGNWIGSETFVPGVSATNSLEIADWNLGNSLWVETTKASDGNKIVYINSDDVDQEVCISQNYSFGSIDIFNDCSTYQVCFDWASFNRDHPNGRTTRSQPALDIAFQNSNDENISFASLPIGNAIANQDWDNFSWTSASLQFQLKGSLTPPPNATRIILFISEYRRAANGLLLDNTRLSVTSSCTEICDNGIDDDEDGFIDSFDPDCVCTVNGLPNIDFNKDTNGDPLVAGTLVGETWAAWGIHITTDAPVERPAMIFDSSNPLLDSDLGTPNSTFGGPGVGSGGEQGQPGENKIALGNVLIIPTSATEINDNRRGGDLIYTFDNPIDLDAIEIVDFDINQVGTATVYDANNNIILQKQIQDYGDNSYQKIRFNAVNVSKLIVSTETSFSIATMLFCDQFEICDNGIDDDGDGLIDGADPDCTVSCPNINIKDGDPSVCLNGSTELTTEATNTNGTCYLQWEASTNNTSWTAMPGATNSTLSIIGLTTPTYYRVSVYCDNNPLCGTKYSQAYFVDIKDCAEICDNGIDDDGDGLTDCDDDDCPTPNIDSVDFTDPTNCPDLDNGTITITATSANDIEYSIDGGTTFQSNGNFTNLVAAVYNVVIRDKESQCEVAYDNNPITLTDPSCKEICDNNIDDDGDGKVDCNDGDCGKPVIDSVTPSNPNNCPTLDNGTITILASGDNLEYSINNGVNYQIAPNFTNLQAGTYNIKVRNKVTDCQETATVTLQDSDCTENCTDGIDNNGDGQVDCDDDACGKPTIIDVNITIPDNCPLATNGIITITASGANLVYSIDGGTTFQNARIFINLSPGSYNIVVKNNTTDCIATHSPAVVIPNPTCEEICDNNIDDDGDGQIDCEDGDCGNPNISDVVGSDPTNCPILDNGEITITATGADLQYSIDGGLSYHSGNKFINLSAGTYHIQVKNNTSGCTTSYINNPIILSDPTCEEECGNGIDDDGDGEIDFQDDDCGTVEPHTYVPNKRWLCEGTDYIFEVPVPFPNFTYSWNFGTYASQNSATGPGPHAIQFTPPTGTAAVYPRVLFTATTTTYSIRDTFDFQVRPTISIASANPITPSDCGATDGSVVIEVNRQADACFELSLDGGNTWELENKVHFDNLSTGSYSVVARYCDASCVSESSIVTLADPTTATVLGNDEFGGICPKQTYTNTVISNDIVKNKNVTYSIVTPTTHGTITMDAKGSFEYTTTEIYCGTDQFSYSVCDPENICCVTAIATLDLGDKVDPILQNVPADVTISCDEEIPLPALITAYDNCPAISINKDEVSTQGLDGCSLHDYTITRSWIARDLCDNTKTAEQVITISDITAPDIFRIYTLPNGKKLVAGVMENVSQEWKTIPFPIQFSQTPLVFTQIVTAEDITPVVTRIRNTSTTQFELKLQEEENGDQSHARESVAWIAIEPGAQTEDYLLETGTVDIKNNWKTINFSNSYSGSPNFFTSLQSVNEIDPSVVRARSLGSTSVSCKVLEEKSKDTEVAHALENMAYLAIGTTGNIRDEKGNIIGEVGRKSIDHNQIKITPKNNYYNPVIITQALTDNGSDPIIQRIDLANQASFEIQLQKWDYLDGTHAIEEVSYLIIEGSIPLDASSICTSGTDDLEIGKDIVAVDNCDPNIVLQYEEGKALSGANRQTIRTWYAEDICGNKTAYSQVINCLGMSLQLKAFLQGALVDNNNEDIMRDDLRRLDLLPLEEPYSDSKEYTHVGQGGGEVVDPSLFQQTGDQAIVDWVFVELKKADNFEEVVATRSALIQRDGNVVNVDGSPIINFFDIPNGEYYVKLRHRNHLPLETLYPYTFTPNNIPFIDFTEDFLPLRGNRTRIDVNGQFAAWSGDLNGDNLTVFQGPNNDIFHMFLQILLDELNQSTLSNFISRGYTNRDFNMDGTVIFQGPNNDRSVLLWNTIFNHPDNELNQSNFVVSIAEIIKDTDIGSCLLDNTQIFCDFDNDGILNGTDPDDDNDGVSDGNDIAPYNNQSDTDKDGISDNEETGNDGSYHRGTDTDPLSACDPFQDNNICIGTDIDEDGFFSNYPLAHGKYDKNDQNSCEPNGIALGCSCPDDDGDGFILICDKNNDIEDGRTIKVRVGDWQANQALGNECGPCLDKTSTPSLPVFDMDNDGYFIGAQPEDTDDNNPCIPNVSSFACQQIDKDLDGYFGNADPSSDNYDLDDNNSCIPAPTILCSGIDHDGDTYFGNFPYGHPLADPNDNDSCVPDIKKCPIDKDQDGYFDNISPVDPQFDPNDADDCIPSDANCGGCPTFQGATFICNNPGTNNEMTLLLEPSEDLANYSNSYCGPCVEFSTIADGDWNEASTWKNGKIPPTNINGLNVSINHALSASNNITIGFNGYLLVKGGRLALKAASLNLTGGVFMAVNANIAVDKTVQIDQVSSKFYIKNSSLLITENYLISNSGVSYFEESCVTVHGDYNIVHGIEVYENTNLIVDRGDVAIGQNSTIVLKYSKMQIAGNFDNKGLLTGMETLPAITFFSVGGDVSNTGLWLCGIENQYCIGGKNEIPELYLKGVENCSGISVFFEEHECP